DALPAPLEAVQHLAARLEHTGVDPDVGQPAQVRITNDLEDQAGHRLFDVRLPNERDLLLLVLGVVALDGLDVHGRRQVGGDRVEQGLHTLVLERGTTQDRYRRTGDGGATDRGYELLHGGLLTLQVQLHDRVVRLVQRLYELLTCLAISVDMSAGDLARLVHL